MYCVNICLFQNEKLKENNKIMEKKNDEFEQEIDRINELNIGLNGI